MKILSITTSSPICSCAVLEDDFLIKEVKLNNGLTHSETLMSIIEQLLKELNLQLNNIDLLVCDIGPGSFTGIRIGIATIKAFADSLNIKTIGVNSLEALSYSIKDSGVICSMIDAKKDNVYSAVFENADKNCIIRHNGSFENIDNLLSEFKNLKLDYNLTFVGSGAIQYKEKILTFLPNSKFSSLNELSAECFGIAGFNKYKIGVFSDLSPFYLRKSEAERNLEEKQSESK